MTNAPCCDDLVNEINQRMLTRNVAYGNLDILLDPRPQQTKYVLPFENTYPPCRNKLVHYNTTQTFNPGNRVGAWSGFSTNINNESILRNQVHALQKYAQAIYVPNSDSDLYNCNVPLSDDNTVETKFPHLFNNNIVNSKRENLGNLNKLAYLQNLGKKLFNNDTRQQLKDS